MAQILKFIRPDNSFDPETLTVLSAAYDLAIASLHDRGQPNAVCEIIAARIVAAAMNGERNHQKLCDVALRGITKRE